MPSGFRSRLEVPIFGEIPGAQAAYVGTSRLELNRSGSYAAGGTTPTVSELLALLSALCSHGTSRPAIRIMIRPRGPPLPSPKSNPKPPTPTAESPKPNLQAQTAHQQQTFQDFIYTPAELATMAASIREFTSSGLLSPELGDGFVFGVLRKPLPGPPSRKGWGEAAVEIDIEQNRRLVELARPFRCVLHRAVDDVFSSLLCLTGSEGGSGGVDAGDGDGVRDGDGRKGEQVIEAGVDEVMGQVRSCGFDGMLTSGGKGRAVDHIGCLKAVVVAGGRQGVEVIVGGGVRSGNLRRLMDGLGDVGGSVWYHSSCLEVGAEVGERFDVDEAKDLIDGLKNAGLGQ
ncbi:Copper homeostasis protein CutC [Madurella mycetomatis]|uniref:Copper homeostasis protein cutC homolog n=1 Tax=Madurella mycetomatis TaxID=100816 RepID=A0A175VWU5_9PEZI|nr:Copper homeostasis protein CutC [Madurella mycetomatis]